MRRPRATPVCLARSLVLAAAVLAASGAALAGVVGDGTPGSCTRDALQQQIDAGGTVTFDCGGAATIAITQTLVVGNTKAVLIDGGGQITLDGLGARQIMLVLGGPAPLPVIEARNITFTRGFNQGGITGQGVGGAIELQGSLLIQGARFADNGASLGGAIATFRCETSGELTCAPSLLDVRNSVFVNNNGFNSAGAIVVHTDKVLITDSTFTANSGQLAGAIRFFSLFRNGKATVVDATISRSTFDRNEARNTSGGAIDIGQLGSNGKLRIENSTFHGNTAIGGGATAVGGAIHLGVALGGIVELSHVTLEGNSATTGGGLRFATNAAQTTMQDSILANNAGGNCAYQTTTTSFLNGKNIQFGDATCLEVPVTDPKLGPLADNGGATPTMALAADSPAIDGAGSVGCPGTDQRGIARVQGAGCDVGAFELRAALPAGRMQGLWWAFPAASESGWGVNFAHQGSIIFVTWFTYGRDGQPLWFVALLDQTGSNVFSGPVFTVTGPPFNAEPFDPATVVETQVGTMTVAFSEIDRAVFSYEVLGIRQTKAISKQIYAAPVPLCTWPAPIALEAANYFQDLWWAKPPGSESGWGINFAHQGTTVFATWFTYGADGKPLWLIVLADQTGPGVFAGPVSTVTGPPFSAIPFDPAIVVETVVGTATLAFTDGNTATFSYTVNGISQTKTITRQVFAEPGTVCQVVAGAS